MSILQAWLVVAVPGLILALSLFYGRSRVRTMLGYATLLLVFGVMLTVDRGSAAVMGIIAALLFAAGRGGRSELEGQDTSTIAVPDSVRRPVRPRADSSS